MLSADVAETIIGKQVHLRESYTYHEANLLACLFRMGTKRQPQDALLLWHQTPNGFELIHHRESLPGETYDKPVPFIANNFTFLNISTEPSGSGGFVQDTMLWLAPDGTAHEVDFHPASEVYEGITGNREIIMTRGRTGIFLPG